MGDEGWTRLAVGGLSNNKLAFTNAVFVSPRQFTSIVGNQVAAGVASGSHVLVKSQPFEISLYELRVDEDTLDSELGMNGLQRNSLNLSQGLPIYVKHIPNAQLSQYTLTSISFEVSALGRTKVVVDEDGLIDFIFKRFPAHIFAKDQALAMDYKGHKLSMNVIEVELTAFENDSGIDHSGFNRLGVILADVTEVNFDCSPKNRILTLNKSKVKSKKNLLSPSFKFEDMGIGGLDKEFSSIFRRAFASRAFPPAVIERLGIKHVRGMLLYGPPGTGKTLIARQIGNMLHGKEPKVVNGPEILSKFVGESEKNIRELFLDAEIDYKENKEESELHTIIFDEIDAICKQRGSNRDGTGVHDTVVNQLLSKMDGVDSLNNILVIGMTNRKDMIDEALLRPGRLEVHVEIGLPDCKGREDIYRIHTKTMVKNKVLEDDVDFQELADYSKNYSGAEIEGVVKCASSFALNSNIDVLDASSVQYNQTAQIKVSRSHFMLALQEVRPAFGVEEDTLNNYVRNGIVSYGPAFDKLEQVARKFFQQLYSSDRTSLLSVLLEGYGGTGKTALAAHLGIQSGFPFVKLITPEDMVGYTESSKCQKIYKIFEDAYKSPQSLIILDNIERILDYVRIGPRFSNPVLQTLLVLIKKVPPNPNCKLMVMGTTGDIVLMQDLMLNSAFQVTLNVPQVEGAESIKSVFAGLDDVEISKSNLERIASELNFPLGIKQLLLVIEMAKQDGSVTFESFVECMKDYGV